MKTLALYNLKGGVGKTAGTVNLAYASVLAGRRTLVWDLDPQAAATFYFRVRPSLKGGRKALLRHKHPLEKHIRGTDFEGIDLVPADFSLRKLDVALDDQKKPSKPLRKLLAPLADDYDTLLLDCPPSISATSRAIFELSDALLVPVIPTTLSLRTLDQLLRHLDAKGPKGIPVWPYFSMVDRRKKMHLELMEQATDEEQFLAASIPSASAVERMGVERMPVGAFDKGPATEAFRALWNEVSERLDAL
ncbi:MAG: ParA family protein [Acidobacteriota bacterium]